MTSYLYAPKDDCKHRAFWRELYTVEEAEHLQSLISAAQESNVDFFYAISPGLDITYSNSKEVGRCLIWENNSFKYFFKYFQKGRALLINSMVFI